MTDKITCTDAATTMRGYLDALTSGDLERIRDYFAPDATWTIHGVLPLAGTYDGATAVMNFLATALSALFEPGTQNFRFGEVLAVGNIAILEWTVTGIGSATGQCYDNDYCGVFTIREGRISAVREYFDTDHVRRVLYGDRTALTAEVD